MRRSPDNRLLVLLRAPLLVPIFVLVSCGSSRQEAPPAAQRPAQSPAAGSEAPLILPEEAKGFVDQGIAEYRQGRYHQAAAAFEKARDKVPADLRVSTLLGTALLQSKQYTPAKEEFERILTLHPEATEPRLGLARIGIRLGDYAAAIPRFKEVLLREPDNPQALYNLGLLLYRVGDYPGSREMLEKVIALKPDLPDAHYTLGLAYGRQQQDDKAEAEFRKTVELAPGNSQAHFNLAKIYLKQGRKDDASREQEIFKKLWDRQAADRAAEGNARALYLAGNYDGALKEYDRLLELTPQSGRFQLGRGQCFIKMGKNAEALEALQKAVALDPKLADAHFHLAVLYRAMGDEAKSDEERQAFEALETIGENKTGF